MQQKIKTFIFDLGKVIVPFELDNQYKIIESVCDFSRVDIEKTVRESIEIIYLEEGKIRPEKLFQSFKKLLGLRMNFEEFVQAWNSIFSSFEPLISEDLIKKLAANHRMIILSDTNELHFEFIKQNFPILRHFDDFVLSYEVGFVKPAPEIFRAAIEKAKCAPEECFYTDDRIINIEGAKKLGINAVQFISAPELEAELERRNLI